MNISFIVLSWNSESYIEKCIESIISDLKMTSFNFDIYIIDNGSKDKTVNILNSLRKLYRGIVKPIFLKKNMGTTYSRNIALRKTNADYIVIMDSDVEIKKGCTEKLTDFLMKNKKVGIVSPRLNYPDGKLQKSTDIFPTLPRKIYRYFFLKHIEKKDAASELNLNIKEVDYAISAMWFIKRDILEKVGLLDEKIFYAPEDVDFCMRTRKAGYKVFYFPEVSSVHHTQEISRGLKINMALFHHLWGLIYFFRKHNYFCFPPKLS